MTHLVVLLARSSQTCICLALTTVIGRHWASFVAHDLGSVDVLRKAWRLCISTRSYKRVVTCCLDIAKLPTHIRASTCCTQLSAHDTMRYIQYILDIIYIMITYITPIVMPN